MSNAGLDAAPAAPRPGTPPHSKRSKVVRIIFSSNIRMISIKKISLSLFLTGLGLFACSSSAFANEVDIGFHANCVSGGVKACLGPWFSYFPYDAYFQMPAPVPPYPNWPMPFPPRPAPAPATGYQAPPMAPPVQPVGYGYPMPYWYGYGYGGYSGR
jgi:hypothetical protein